MSRLLVVLLYALASACQRRERPAGPAGDSLAALPEPRFAMAATSVNGPDSATVTVRRYRKGQLVDTTALALASEVRVESVTVAVPASVQRVEHECLTRPGTAVKLQPQLDRYDSRPPPKGTGALGPGIVVDARATTFKGASAYPINWASAGDGCWMGGRYLGAFDTLGPWAPTYHSDASGGGATAMFVIGARSTVEGLHAFNSGDGISYASGPANGRHRIAHNWLQQMHDDCLELDRYGTFVIEDNWLDGCYVAFSARPPANEEAATNGSKDTVYVRHNIIRMGDQKGVYSGPPWQTGTIFKVAVVNKASAINWVVEDNVFLVDKPGLSPQSLCLQQGNKIAAKRNTVVWLGQGPYPCPIPDGYALANARALYDLATTDWKARHPTVQ